LPRVGVEKYLEFTVLDAGGGRTKAVLTIFASLDQVVQRRDRFVIVCCPLNAFVSFMKKLLSVRAW
jgi:hypothetical protein